MVKNSGNPIDVLFVVDVIVNPASILLFVCLLNYVCFMLFTNTNFQSTSKYFSKYFQSTQERIGIAWACETTGNCSSFDRPEWNASGRTNHWNAVCSKVVIYHYSCRFGPWWQSLFTSMQTGQFFCCGSFSSCETELMWQSWRAEPAARGDPHLSPAGFSIPDALCWLSASQQTDMISVLCAVTLSHCYQQCVMCWVWGLGVSVTQVSLCLLQHSWWAPWFLHASLGTKCCPHFLLDVRPHWIWLDCQEQPIFLVGSMEQDLHVQHGGLVERWICSQEGFHGLHSSSEGLLAPRWRAQLGLEKLWNPS